MSNLLSTQNNSTKASGNNAAAGAEKGEGAVNQAGTSAYQARQTPSGTLLFVETKVALGGLSLPARPKTGAG